ncbi:hypothetical protein [Escherichia coli Nissle 1917]|nr:hypothetical protein [Escherichia coli Nissle 1917]
MAVRAAAELPHLPAAGYPDDIGHVTERERRHGVDAAVL